MMYLIENRIALLTSAALILVPLFTWRNLYETYRSLKRKYDEDVLFQKRHNCVIMYSEFKGMSGWPPHLERIKVDFDKENCLARLREPVIYFIDTARVSLDIAFMLVTVKSVYQALIRARHNGIRVRLLLNFESMKSRLNDIKSLIKEGIEVVTYISNGSGMCTIMHHKYIVKDYTLSNGYLCTGSLNLTDSGFVNNYEDMVFTSNQYLVQAFHKDFEESWSLISIDNENLMNKNTLLDANFV
ncbi:hypothetical protein NQ315_006156 [Exocentrus adspersus]|uniref:Mitochondrial cardiolipin hydrolase n=1 Tax=Exocentrus adspersus TaxID=1586481 RepID=A0AAV8VZE0_9CUCU|nr:hypothetical protein NQ315_006156 [Exocentrus adspersus]